MDKTLTHLFQRQINGWFCGPASVRVALSCFGIVREQTELAGYLKTTTNGTNSINNVVETMNAWVGAGKYGAYWIGEDATPQQAADLRTNGVASIKAGKPLVCNVVGPISPIDGGYYDYAGGHYVAVTGFQADGDRFLVSDINVKEYWVTVEQLATWIAGRGYSYGLVDAVVAPSPPVTAPPAPSSFLYLIDLASHQEGIDLAAAKAHGVEVVNIKTSEGVGYKWSRAKEYADVARSLGLSLSTFHWLDSSGTGTQQARIAYELMKWVGNGSTDGIAHQCDCEDDASYQQYAEYMTEMQRLLGRPVYTYTGDWWWVQRGWNGRDFSPFLMAAANEQAYSGYHGYPHESWTAGYGGWNELSALQFAVTPIPGFAGNVSRTMFKKSAWYALTGNVEGQGEDKVLVIVKSTDSKLWLSDYVSRREIPNEILAGTQKTWLEHLKFWLAYSGTPVKELPDAFAPTVLDGVFGPSVGAVVIPPLPPVTAVVDYDKVKEATKEALREGTV